jgi:uncharacterized protein (TIRG00374 family)
LSATNDLNRAATDEVTSKDLLTLDQSIKETVTEAGEISREELSLRKRFLNWRTLIPLVVVLGLLYFLARQTNINPQKTWATIQHANLLYFLAAFGIFYFSFIIRALRWRILLQNAGFTQEQGLKLPGVLKIVEIIYISFFVNSVVPAKAGDLYRAYLLRQEVGGSTTRSFATVVAERLLDLSMLLLLFIPAILISLRDHLPPQLQIGLFVALGVVIVALGVLIVLRLARERIAQLVPEKFREHFYHFQEGTLGSFRRLPLLGTLTAGVWICEGLRFFFIALALNLFEGNPLFILAASVVVGLGESLLTAVPTTGGGVGLVEGGMGAIIALYYTGADLANQAAAAILLERTITLFSLLFFGCIVFLFAFGRKAVKGKQQGPLPHSES